jgi:hypothetical protein
MIGRTHPSTTKPCMLAEVEKSMDGDVCFFNSVDTRYKIEKPSGQYLRLMVMSN